jgi:hypothetical protein
VWLVAVVRGVAECGWWLWLQLGVWLVAVVVGVTG